MLRLVRAATAALLLSGGVVACTAVTPAGPVYCHGQKATIVVSATSPTVVSGTAHNDVIAVTGGLHEVHGGAGDDLMCADSVGSILNGGDGNDTLVGAGGADRLFGANGNDTLLGGGGQDLLVGGAGTDTVSFADQNVPVKASIDGLADSGVAHEHDVIDPSVENLVGGSSTNALTGDAAPNILIGEGAHDVLTGGAGNDVLEGQGGDDTLDGQSGNDTLKGGSGVNGCDLDAADTVTQNCRFDMVPPVLSGFQVVTPTVDITAGQTELTLQAELTDNLSGVNEVTAQFCDATGALDPIPSLDLFKTAGTTTNGVWQGTTNLSSFTTGGIYTVCVVNVSDNATNLATYTSKGWAGVVSPPQGTYGFTVVNGQMDTTAPVITNIVTTPSVDVTSGAATVTTDFTVVEDGSGIDLLNVGIAHGLDYPDPSNQLHQADLTLMTPSTSGAAGSGRYRAVSQVPVGSAAGSWKVNIYARDLLQNVGLANSPLTVVDANPITSMPQLGFVSRDVTTTTPYTQTFTVHVTSARADVTSIEMQVRGPNAQWANGYFALASGTSLDGLWTATIQLPSTVAAGSWSVSSMSITDVLGRSLPIINPSVVGGGWTVS